MVICLSLTESKLTRSHLIFGRLFSLRLLDFSLEEMAKNKSKKSKII